MRLLGTVAAVTVAIFAAISGVAAGSDRHAARTQAVAITKTTHVRSRTRTPRARTLVSVRLTGIGGQVTSPRGPFRVRPTKIAFDVGGPDGTKDLWIDDLKWVGWGQTVAYASGVVHARVGPGHPYVTTAGGILLDQLRSCGTKPSSYYTSAYMAVPDGFPQNTESTATAIGEQALTPC